MLKKYVVYYKERKYKDKDIWREFFKVEKHPKLDKPWTGSKADKISILDKLKQANKIVEDLDNDTYEEKESDYPKYVNKRYNKTRKHYFLIYERVLDGTTKKVTMKLPDEYDLPEQLIKLEKNIQKNYSDYKHIYSS